MSANLPAESLPQLVALGVLFILFCLLHSLLAASACKRWLGSRWPRLCSSYRLLYNLLALVTLAPALWLLWQWPGETIWVRPGWLRGVADGLALAAVAAFLHSLGSYDLGLFSGTRQWREHSADVDGDERLRIGFWHRFVRHPWYCFALVVLWTRDMNAAQLLFYWLATLYLVVGSWLEERKLIACFGDAYRVYRRRVPGLLPWPGRWLSGDEARRLEAQAAGRLIQ